MKVVIVDYGVGNIRSLSNALEKIGCEVVLTRDSQQILAAERVILPGVGSFPYCMAKLREYGLDSSIKQYVAQGKSILGICVGMQMLFDYGEEHGGAEGLGIIQGRVVHFSNYAANNKLAAPQRLPHIDWSRVNIRHDPDCVNLFTDVDLNGFYYFVHSFVCVPENKQNILGSTICDGVEYCSMVLQDQVCGVQFHPEKSGILGLSLLKAFVFR